MPAIERSEIVAQLITGCSYPRRSDVEDHTCHICLKSSLGPQGDEIPIKLRCGHILGMACLTTWAFRQIEEVGNNSPGCPFCRASLLSRESEEVSDLFISLASWTPGGGAQYEQDEDSADTWIDRAEKLWDDLCKAILDDLDTIDVALGPGPAIEVFYCGSARLAEQFLSFGSVFNFFQHYIRLGWRPLTDGIPRAFPGQYKKLTDHLKAFWRVGLDEDLWRVRQAWQRPQNQLDMFRGRLERSRAELGKRVQQMRDGEA
ncbi:MAG: hypothetical protein L6R40_008602 [Gallowayella cf. fulva]|nr:MAG: hypothetical protein L6R40_008602 [Xanthomendoza cf. fulva]